MVAPLIKGLVLGLILSISVGPIIFAIIKHSINSGRKAGLSFVAGVSTSDISLVLFCNFFTGLFATALEHKNKIALAGSIFLIAMGIYTLFFKKVSITENANGAHEKLRPKLNTKNLHLINQIAGVILIGFGVFLFYGALK